MINWIGWDKGDCESDCFSSCGFGKEWEGMGVMD